MGPELWLNALLGGLLGGAVYALMAIGLALIYGVARIVNFAHGEWVAAGMCFTAAAAGHDSPLQAAPWVMLAFFAAGYALQRLLTQRLHGSGEQTQFLLLLALAMVMANALLLVFGPDARHARTEAALQSLQWGALIVDRARATAAIVAALLSAVLFAWLRWSRVGLAIRAVADNPAGARVIGLPLAHLFALTYGIGCACAGAAGTLLVTIEDVTPASGPGYTLLAFAIVIAGGLGSLSGALLAGILIGVSEAAAGLLISPSAKSLASFGVMIGVIAWRPHGLGRRSA